MVKGFCVSSTPNSLKVTEQNNLGTFKQWPLTWHLPLSSSTNFLEENSTTKCSHFPFFRFQNSCCLDWLQETLKSEKETETGLEKGLIVVRPAFSTERWVCRHRPLSCQTRTQKPWVFAEAGPQGRSRQGWSQERGPEQVGSSWPAAWTDPSCNPSLKLQPCSRFSHPLPPQTPASSHGHERQLHPFLRRRRALQTLTKWGTAPAGQQGPGVGGIPQTSPPPGPLQLSPHLKVQGRETGEAGPGEDLNQELRIKNYLEEPAQMWYSSRVSSGSHSSAKFWPCCLPITPLLLFSIRVKWHVCEEVGIKV